MKWFIATLIAIFVALGSSAEMAVNGVFDSAIGSTGADTIDPDGSGNDQDTSLIIDAGWFSKTGGEFYINSNQLIRDPSSATRWSFVGVGQIVTASAAAANGEAITLSFDQDVTDADGNSGYKVYLWGYDQTGTGDLEKPQAWMVNSGDGIDLLNPVAGDNTGAGNYDVYELTSDSFMTGADSNYTVSVTLTRDYEYFGIELVGKAQNNDAWTLDNVSLAEGGAVVDPDADSDGMDDAWEIQYFGSTNAVNGGPLEDWDIDTYNNLWEFDNGTNPTNALDPAPAVDPNGNLVANGSFDAALTGNLGASGTYFSGDNPAGNNIDAGWFENASGNWDIATGAAVRDNGDANAFVERGLAQFITCVYSNGDSATVSFDYDIIDDDADANILFQLYAFNQTGTDGWLEGSGDGVDLFGPIDAGDRTGSGNYDAIELINESFTATASGTYSNVLSLTEDYEYLAIVFSSKAPDGTDSTSIDNVSLTKGGEAIDPDADGDEMNDLWEIQYFGSTNAVNGGPQEDWDSDTYVNLWEFDNGTNPTNALDPAPSIDPEGNIIVNGSFAAALAGNVGASGTYFSGDNPVGDNIDAGWFENAAGNWDISTGEAVRDNDDANKDSERGLAQIVTSVYEAGYSVTISFDYDFTDEDGDCNGLFQLYAFNQRGAGTVWMEGSGDGVDLFGPIDSGDRIDSGNYDAYELVSQVIAGTAAGVFSNTVVLTEDYEYLAVVFTGKAKDAAVGPTPADSMSFDNVSLQLADGGTPDADGDGMDDSWEKLHFGGINEVNGAADDDWDQDTMINLHEYLAGTIPTSVTSLLELNAVIEGDSSNEYFVTWQAVDGKSYQLLTSDALTSEWTTNATDIAGTEPDCTVTATVTSSTGFFKVKLEQ